MELLEKHFDIAFTASDGIKKLRELILILAMQGKLVPQDPNDQPASELLKMIRTERKGLVKENKIKSVKTSSDTNPEAATYELPKGWERVKFGEVYSFEYGDNLPADKRSNSGEFPVYGSNGIVGSHNIPFVNSPCIVVGRKGSAGALNLSSTKGCCVTDVAFYCVPPNSLDINFSFKLFHTLGLNSLGKGIKPGLNRNEVYVLPVPIPPLAEQRRIVTKIDQLMARCDELEKLRAEREQKRSNVHISAINRLLTAHENSTFTDAWRFISKHFGKLYLVKENVAELRKAILQLAVMGKLVPQDPKDQPASQLLKKIEAEKKRLVKEQSLRTEANEYIENSEEYLGKPSGWEYCRLGNLAKFIDYRGRTPNKVNSGIPLITAKNVRFGFINREPYEYVTENEYESWMTRGFPKQGDLLFTTEAPLGNIAVVDIHERFALAQRVICFQLHEPEMNCFLKWLIMSGAFQAQLNDNATGMTATGIKASRLKEIPIPVPPLPEQRRIGAKIDKLMAMCDELDKQIDASKQKQTTLLNAIMAQV